MSRLLRLGQGRNLTDDRRSRSCRKGTFLNKKLKIKN